MMLKVKIFYLRILLIQFFTFKSVVQTLYQLLSKNSDGQKIVCELENQIKNTFYCFDMLIIHKENFCMDPNVY